MFCSVFFMQSFHSRFLTLYGRRANDESLLEGLGLSAQLGRSGLQRNTLLGQTRDVDGGLLVEAGLVVQQRHVAAQRQRLTSCGGHLEETR